MPSNRGYDRPRRSHLSGARHMAELILAWLTEDELAKNRLASFTAGGW
jgi:hypothetical protein